MIRVWIEAMRLRTLPVSVAGVIAGCGCAVMLNSFKAVPAVYLALHVLTWMQIKRAVNLLVFALMFLGVCF